MAEPRSGKRVEFSGCVDFEKNGRAIEELGRLGSDGPGSGGGGGNRD
jgi:hypothetical protein